MKTVTLKEWYSEYGPVRLFFVWLKYMFDPYRKTMALDCYLYYRFDIISKTAKKDILLDHEIKEYEKKFNNDAYREIFNNKKLFYQYFKKYMHRDIIFLDDIEYENFKEFIVKHEKIVVKPVASFGGQGLKIFENKNLDDDYLKKEFDLLKSIGYVAEEYLTNEISYREIYDKSLNTIRVNTLVKKNHEIEIFAVVNQFGTGGSITDNDEELGIWSAADTETGIIIAAEKDDETAVYYDIHPDTRKPIIGFKNKEFDKVKKLAVELAGICPECRLIGWDIAITNKGIELIEGNVTPELGVYQAMTGKGLRMLFEREIM